MDFYTDAQIKFVGLLTEEYYNELISFNTLERWFVGSPIIETIGYGIKRHKFTQPSFNLGSGKDTQSPPSLILLGKRELNSFPLCLLHNEGLIPVWEICWVYSHSYHYKVKNRRGDLMATFYDKEILSLCLDAIKSKSESALYVETLDESGALMDSHDIH